MGRVMRTAPLVALLLSAAIAMPAAAEAVMPAWAMLSLAPSLISADVSESLSKAMPGDAGKNRQMQVTAIRQQGNRTALTLRSKDGVTQVDTLVSSAAARAQAVQVNDMLDIEAIGQTGFAVKKAGATLVVLARPDTGLVHSKART